MFSYFSLFVTLITLQTVCSLSNICYGYWGTWSVYRKGNGKFTVTDIDPTLFTHLAYSFFGIDAQGNMNLLDSNLDVNQGNIAKFIALKQKNPNLKMMAAIGGFGQGSVNFSKVAANAALRAKFVQNVVNFLAKYKFDGLDLDWEFPAQNGGSPADFQNYITLLQQLKNAFKTRYLLAVAVAAPASSVQTSYNVPAMNKIVDFFNVMAYDFHGSWESKTGVNAPLFAQKTDPAGNTANVNSAIRNWIARGASPGKLVLGLGAYGRSFKLANANQAGTGAPSTGAGDPGPYTGEAGLRSYLEICEAQKNNPKAWKKTNVDNNYVYANSDKLWVGYDDANTMKKKGQFARNLKLAGVMFWTIDNEDFRGICGQKNGLIRSALAGYKGQ